MTQGAGAAGAVSVDIADEVSSMAAGAEGNAGDAAMIFDSVVSIVGSVRVVAVGTGGGC